MINFLSFSNWLKAFLFMDHGLFVRSSMNLTIERNSNRLSHLYHKLKTSNSIGIPCSFGEKVIEKDYFRDFVSNAEMKVRMLIRMS